MKKTKTLRFMIVVNLWAPYLKRRRYDLNYALQRVRSWRSYICHYDWFVTNRALLKELKSTTWS